MRERIVSYEKRIVPYKKRIVPYEKRIVLYEKRIVLYKGYKNRMKSVRETYMYMYNFLWEFYFPLCNE